MGKTVTMRDVLEHPEYLTGVVNALTKYQGRHALRPTTKQGMRYRRNWYDELTDVSEKDEQGRINAGWLIVECAKVWAKKSTLSANVRFGIRVICDPVANEVWKNIEAEKKSVGV